MIAIPSRGFGCPSTVCTPGVIQDRLLELVVTFQPSGGRSAGGLGPAKNNPASSGKWGSTIHQIEELIGIIVGVADTDEGEAVVTLFGLASWVMAIRWLFSVWPGGLGPSSADYGNGGPSSRAQEWAIL